MTYKVIRLRIYDFVLANIYSRPDMLEDLFYAKKYINRIIAGSTNISVNLCQSIMGK